MSTTRNPEEIWNILNNLNQLELAFLEQTPDSSSFDDVWTFLNFMEHSFIKSNHLANVYFQQLPRDVSIMNSFWKNLSNLDEAYCIYSGLDISIFKQYNLPNFRLHSAGCFECIYVLQGSGTFQLSDKTFPLRPGDFFFHQPGEKYLLNSDPDSILVNLELRKSFIYDNYQTLFANCPAALHFFDNSYRSQLKHNYLCFHSENQHEFQNIILQMFAEALSPGTFKNDILRSYFELLVTYLKRYGTDSILAAKKPSAKEVYFNNIVVYLKENYRTADLYSTSHNFHLSKNYISRIVHTMTGDSFIDLLSQIRIEKVKEYLIETDLILDDIAELTGFTDASYLWRVFKKQTGNSPSEYRKKKP